MRREKLGSKEVNSNQQSVFDYIPHHPLTTGLSVSTDNMSAVNCREQVGCGRAEALNKKPVARRPGDKGLTNE